jgi:hypothetical protein
MSTLVTDGATVNDVIARNVSKALLTLYDVPPNSAMHINCFAHIINLVVQDFMAALEEGDPCEQDGGDTDHFRLHKDSPVCYDPDKDQDLQELEANREKELDDAEDNECPEEEMDEVLKLLAAATSEAELAAVGHSKLKRVSVSRFCSDFPASNH